MKMSLKTTFYWSLGGHVLFFLMILVVSLITSCSRNRNPKEEHIFRLQAGPPAPKVNIAAPVKKSNPTPKQSEIKPPPKKTPPPKPEPKKKEPEPTKKQESKPVSYDDFLKNHELPEPTPTKPTPQPQQTTTRKTDSNEILKKELEQIIQGFGGTDTSSDQMQEFNRYIGQLRTQLNRLWLQPDNLPPGKWSALIEFTVERNGKVVRVHFKEKSGNYDFDQSLIRAMNAFVSTTPPPGGKSQVFTIPFSMTVR